VEDLQSKVDLISEMFGMCRCLLISRALVLWEVKVVATESSWLWWKNH